MLSGRLKIAFFTLSFAACFCLVVLMPVNVVAQTTTWLGGNGDWLDAANWSNGVPTTENNDVEIDGGNVVNSNVSGASNFFAHDLEVSAGDSVSIGSVSGGRYLGVWGSLSNSGTIVAGPAPANDLNRFAIYQTISATGNGEIKLEGGGAIIGADASAHLINEDNLIHGDGSVGWAFNTLRMDITNRSTIEADTGTLNIQSGYDGSTTTRLLRNEGLLTATGGGTLIIDDIDFDNTGGVVVCEPGSRVEITPISDVAMMTALLTGGNFINMVGGEFFIEGDIHDVAFAGEISVGQNVFSGAIHNTGEIRFDDTYFPAHIVFGGDVVLTGGGTVVSPLYYLTAPINYASSLNNVDNSIEGSAILAAPTITCGANSKLAPGLNDYEELNLDRFGCIVVAGDMTVDGTIELDLRDPFTFGCDVFFNEFYNDAILDHGVGSNIIDLNGGINVKFWPYNPPSVGDWFDVVSFGTINVGPDFNITAEGGFQVSHQVIPDSGSGFETLRLTVDAIPPALPLNTMTVTKGDLNAGNVSDLVDSDNADVSIQRSSISATSVVEFEVEVATTTLSPSTIQATVESSVFARTLVNLNVELFNHVSGQFDSLGVRPASRFQDETVTFVAYEDCNEYVNQSSGLLVFRIRLKSPVNRQRFTANVDQLRVLVNE